MGRIKGSKNKPKIERLDTAMTPAEIEEDAELFKPENLIAKIPFESRDETPYPSNWESLSKVDKLSWLTSNRRK